MLTSQINLTTSQLERGNKAGARTGFRVWFLRSIVAALVSVAFTTSLIEHSSKPATAVASVMPLPTTCAWNVWYQIGGNSPFVYWQVNGTGFINQSPDKFCNSDWGWVSVQKKVCGWWGCNWEQKAGIDGQVTTANWARATGANCGGTHRWRVETTFKAWLFDLTIPGMVPWFQDGRGPELMLVC
jgi:hypothetical protein